MSTTHGRLSRQAAIRLQGGELILRGFDDDEIVDILDVSLSSVERWRKKVESDGLSALVRKYGSGRSSELSSEQLQELKTVNPARSQSLRLPCRPMDLAYRRRSHSEKMGRRILAIQCTKNAFQSRFVLPQTRRQVDEVFAGSRRSLAAVRLATNQKKADKNGLTLSIRDESGFSFVPNVGKTWAPILLAVFLEYAPGRHDPTGLGSITCTPSRSLLKFRFSISGGAASFEDFVFRLAELHHYYGKKVLILWDHLPVHHAAEFSYEDEHPKWFDFYYFSTYSPELNPVEQCWNQMKNVYLCNFVPASDDELTSTVDAAAMRINEEHLLPSFFEHAGISF